MGELYKLDLSDVLNHKIVYDANVDSDEGLGLDGEFLDRNVFVQLWESSVKNMFGLFDRTYDNIECNGQSIEIGAMASKLHFLGFFYWGDSVEHVAVEFEDGITEIVNVMFGDWTRVLNGETNLLTEYSSETSRTAFSLTSKGKAIHIVCLHHAECGLKHRGKRISRIILPENMFMHIFAITLEN